MPSDRYSEPPGPELNGQGFFPAYRESRFALSADLGQTTDFTALAVIERVREPIPPPEGVGEDLRQRLAPPVYHVRWLERLPLGTSYIAAIAHITGLLQRALLAGRCRLILDRTGVGRPVADLFIHAGLNPICVTITAGDGEHMESDGSGYRVSKLQLISRLQAELHAGSLKIARALPEAAVLASELSDFRVTISEIGYASFGARTGRHDDLVLSVALGLWHLSGERNAWRVAPLEL